MINFTITWFLFIYQTPQHGSTFNHHHASLVWSQTLNGSGTYSCEVHVMLEPSCKGFWLPGWQMVPCPWDFRLCWCRYQSSNGSGMHSCEVHVMPEPSCKGFWLPEWQMVQCQQWIFVLTITSYILHTPLDRYI